MREEGFTRTSRSHCRALASEPISHKTTTTKAAMSKGLAARSKEVLGGAGDAKPIGGGFAIAEILLNLHAIAGAGEPVPAKLLHMAEKRHAKAGIGNDD